MEERVFKIPVFLTSGGWAGGAAEACQAPTAGLDCLISGLDCLISGLDCLTPGLDCLMCATALRVVM